MRTLSVPAVLALCCTAGAAWADRGLNIDAEQVPWPRLQARVGVSTALPLSTDLVSGGHVQGGRVVGDYYFSGSMLGGLGLAGGFRATSGLLLGARGLSLSLPSVPRIGSAFSLNQQQGISALAGGDTAGDSARTVPYLGVGYTGLSVKGSWGFTADLGLMALGGGNGLRLGRAATSEEAVRDWRGVTPVLQVGLSYSF